MDRAEEQRVSVIELGDASGFVSESDFSDYMAGKLHMSQTPSDNFSVFWNEKYDESNTPQASLSSKIKVALQLLRFSLSQYILAQFWALVTIDGRHVLTSSDQPYGMTHSRRGLQKGLCRYKKICASNDYDAEGESSGNFLPTGPPSRVFLNGSPEYSPNIQFYSNQEYPLRDDADRCKILHYLALPVFEISSKSCLGVLELVASSGSNVMRRGLADIIKQISANLERVELRTFDIDPQFEWKMISEGRRRACTEIQQGLYEVIRKHHLPFAQAWTRRSDSNSTGEAMLTATVSSLTALGFKTILQDACHFFGLKKAKGVVWRAFLSQSSCFCRDVTQLRITEYPFAHIAKVLGLRSSLAICLQSYRTADDNYVLEFFLPTNTDRDPQTWLDSLVFTMKGYLKSFKFASGQELGKGLDLQVLGSSEDKKFDSFAVLHRQTEEISDGQEQDGTMLLENVLEEQHRSELEASSSHVLHALPFPQDVTHISNQKYNREDFILPHDFDLPQFDWRNYTLPHYLLDWPDLSVYSQRDGTDISNAQSASESFPGFDTAISNVRSFNAKSNASNAVDEENVSASLQQFTDDEILESPMEDNATNAGRSVANLEYNSDIQSGEESMQAESIPKEINREVLKRHFGLKREDAAQMLGVSTSTLKRRCRGHGIRRWPSAKRKPVTCNKETKTSNYDQEWPHLNLSSGEGTTSSTGGSATYKAESFPQAETADNTSTVNSGGATTSSASSFLQAATTDNIGIMTVKAECGRKIIKFELPLSSGMIDLEKEVAMRLS